MWKGRFIVKAAALIATRNFICSLRSDKFSVHSSEIPVVVGLDARLYSLHAQFGSEVEVKRPKGIPALPPEWYVAFSEFDGTAILWKSETNDGEHWRKLVHTHQPFECVTN